MYTSSSQFEGGRFHSACVTYSLLSFTFHYSFLIWFVATGGSAIWVDHKPWWVWSAWFGL